MDVPILTHPFFVRLSNIAKSNVVLLIRASASRHQQHRRQAATSVGWDIVQGTDVTQVIASDVWVLLA